MGEDMKDNQNNNKIASTEKTFKPINPRYDGNANSQNHATFFNQHFAGRQTNCIEQIESYRKVIKETDWQTSWNGLRTDGFLCGVCSEPSDEDINRVHELEEKMQNLQNEVIKCRQ